VGTTALGVISTVCELEARKTALIKKQSKKFFSFFLLLFISGFQKYLEITE